MSSDSEEYQRWREPKTCFVPTCTNNDVEKPGVRFFTIRKELKYSWCQLVGRNCPKRQLFCCEDHLNLEQDLDNYEQYISGAKPRLKLNATLKNIPRQVDAASSNALDIENPNNMPNDMENFMEYHIMGSVTQIRMKPDCLPTKFDCQTNRKRTSDTSKPKTVKKQRKAMIKECIKDKDQNQGLLVQRCDEDNEVPTGCSEPQQQKKVLKINTGVQVDMRTEYISKCTQTPSISQHSKQTSSIKISNTSVSRSPLKKVHEECDLPDSDLFSYTPSLPRPCSSRLSNSLQAQSDNTSYDQDDKLKDEKLSCSIKKIIVNKIEKNPLFYIGVPKGCYFLLKIMNQFTGIPEQHILLCLKKIRLNNTFLELGDDFALTKSYADSIFMDNIPVIANFMRQFIVKSEEVVIKKRLPISFRHYFYNVSCIIDCLEIEIEKPSEAVHQSLTWSEYKKANTLKYLISSTPNGLVNYISPGYGGRISDACLVENCDFLNCLPRGSIIVADRGFEHLENLLNQVECQFMRLPSVEGGSKLTKQIASLRIHIERVIRRLREFSMLKLNSCVHNQLNDRLDDVIVIACGLINLEIN